MTVLEAVLLGLVQGFTEFLPVSSSGHLVLGGALLGLDTPGVLFEVTVHVGTLVAVCWVYRRRLLELGTGALRGDIASLAYVGLLALATVPAGAAGVGLTDLVESTFGRPVLAAGMLLVTGAIISTLRFSGPRADREAIRVPDAVVIGLAQALALLPGISRSGTTVAAGTARGTVPGRVAEFSFLLSIPAIAGAAALQIPAIADGGAEGFGPPALGAAFTAALVSGVLAIRIFLHMLRGRTFHRFAYYCWAAGGAYLIAAWFQPALR